MSSLFRNSALETVFRSFPNNPERQKLTTVGTQIIADPGKCFQELMFDQLLILLQDGPCQELIILSSKFQALVFLQDKLLESAWKQLIPVEKS